MGVKGLMTFIEQHTTNPEIVSLVEEARRHSRKYECIPVLAIDGLNIIRDIYQEPEPIIFGGQWRHFVRCIKKFVEKLQLLQIKPVFFFDGALKEHQKEEWAKRRREELEEVKSIFKELVTCPCNELKDRYLDIPPSVQHFAKFIVNCECNCDVRVCVDDPDWTVAKFAKEAKECFGILAADTDYLIFDTKPLYLVTKLDFDTLRIEVWRRERIVKILGISASFFPLLSCMAGNDIVPLNKLTAFHQWLSLLLQSGQKNRIQNIISYLQKKSNKLGDIKNLEIIMEIPADLIQISLDRYNLNRSESVAEEREWCSAELLSLISKRCNMCETPATVFNLLHYKRNSFKPYFHDPSMTPASLVYRKMRQRMYSILFGSKGTVEELCAYEGSNLMDPELVPAIGIDIEGGVPSLMDLWSHKIDLDIRWKLFVSCLGIKISVAKLETMDSKYITMCCILNYLLQCEDLSLRDYEVKAFICQAIYPCSDNLLYLHDLEVDIVTPRSLSLVAYFVAGITDIVSVLDVCGSPFPIEKVMPWKYFDGKLFHHCHNLLKDGVTPEGVRALKKKRQLYRELYQVATTGTSLMDSKPF